MKNYIDFNTAVEKAKKRNPKYNVCIEHTNAWSFSYDDGEERVGGADSGIIVLKDGGKLLMPYEYYMSNIGKNVIVKKYKI